MARPLALACLLAATIIWGPAFIAQKSAMEVMGPLTFIAARFLFAALGGGLVMGERLAPPGYIGAGLIFIAIVLIETVPALAARRTPPVTPSG